MPLSVPRPLSIASTISSMFSMRAWFGPVSQIASIAGSATMSAIDSYGLRVADVERRARSARPRAAFFAFGLQTPRTSASRTPLKPDVEARVEAAADEADAESRLSRSMSLLRLAGSMRASHLVVAHAELLRARLGGQPFQSG